MVSLVYAWFVDGARSARAIVPMMHGLNLRWIIVAHVLKTVGKVLVHRLQCTVLTRRVIGAQQVRECVGAGVCLYSFLPLGLQLQDEIGRASCREGDEVHGRVQDGHKG